MTWAVEVLWESAFAVSPSSSPSAWPSLPVSVWTSSSACSSSDASPSSSASSSPHSAPPSSWTPSHHWPPPSPRSPASAPPASAPRFPWSPRSCSRPDLSASSWPGCPGRLGTRHWGRYPQCLPGTPPGPPSPRDTSWRSPRTSWSCWSFPGSPQSKTPGTAWSCCHNTSAWRRPCRAPPLSADCRPGHCLQHTACQSQHTPPSAAAGHCSLQQTRDQGSGHRWHLIHCILAASCSSLSTL